MSNVISWLVSDVALFAVNRVFSIIFLLMCYSSFQYFTGRLVIWTAASFCLCLCFTPLSGAVLTTIGFVMLYCTYFYLSKFLVKLKVLHCSLFSLWFLRLHLMKNLIFSIQDESRSLAGERGYGQLRTLQRVFRTRQQYMVSQVHMLYPVRVAIGQAPEQELEFFNNSSSSGNGSYDDLFRQYFHACGLAWKF